MRIANRIASILIFVLGIYIIVEALKFDYFLEGTPGPGFLPFWIGSAISAVALIPFIKTFTQFASKMSNPFNKEEFRSFFIVIGGSVVVVIITPITGILIALGLLAGTIAKLTGTDSWKLVIGITVCTPLLLYVIFDMILKVPLPTGFLGF